MKNTSDLGEMLRRIKKGDDEAINIFFKQCHGHIVGVFKSKFGENYYYDQLEEFEQTCHIKLIYALAKFQGTELPVFHAYCNKVIKNSLIDFIKEEKKKPISLDLQEESNLAIKSITTEQYELEDAVIDKLDLREKINFIFYNELSEWEKKLLLVIMKGKCIKEYGKQQHISYSTARKRKERLLKKIGGLLDEERIKVDENCGSSLGGL